MFVLVGGAIALLKLLQILWRQYNRRQSPAEEENSDPRNGSVRCFVFIGVENDDNSILSPFLPSDLYGCFDEFISHSVVYLW